MNLNKLFPRLSIRAKLQIAFAALALVPLGVVAALTIAITVARLRAHGEEMLQHDLQAAQREAERAFGVVLGDVAHIGEDIVAPTMCHREPLDVREAQEIAAYIRRRPDWFRIRVIDAEGVALYRITAAPPYQEPGNGAEPYYHFRAAALAPGHSLMLPVEVPGAVSPDPTAAVAVIVPLYDQAHYCGAVIGEAYASRLFAGIAAVPPLFRGVTALIDADGFFLYHSQGKPNWDRLLAANVTSGTGLVEQIQTSGTRQGDLIRSASIPLAGTGAPLTLVRAVPLMALLAPVQQFLTAVVALGVAISVGVILLARVAGRQFSQPIYLLHAAAGRLAAGEPMPPLAISSNDEIEDLAERFQEMARRLTHHRTTLETLVTDRTKRLAETHAELAQILSLSADPILGLDAGGRIRHWNRGAEALFGYTAEEAVGQPADALLLPPGDRGVEADYIARALADQGAVVNLPTRRRAKDGTVIPVSVTQTVLRNPAGAVQGMSVILRDARQQTALEERMKRSERLAAVSMMAAGLAHEINNPVAILANRIECMEADAAESGNPQFERDLAVLREHALRLSRITTTLRDFSREYDDRTDPVAIALVAQRIQGLLEQTLAGRGVTLRCTIPPTVPPIMIGESALETVLINLVTNGADAMPHGGIVTVSARETPGSAVVEVVVADEGDGIPPDLRDRIFEPFFSTKSAHRGMGLGLALCRSIVERVGGTIRAEGTRDTGGRIILQLPSAGTEAT